MNGVRPLTFFPMGSKANELSGGNIYQLSPNEDNLDRLERMEEVTHLDVSQYDGICELPWPPNTTKLTIKECHFNFMEGWLSQGNCPDSLQELYVVDSAFVPFEFQMYFDSITTRSQHSGL